MELKDLYGQGFLLILLVIQHLQLLALILVRIIGEVGPGVRRIHHILSIGILVPGLEATNIDQHLIATVVTKVNPILRLRDDSFL